ncbi:MAG: carbohydrate ABC transporter permease [Clostridia bacterium]|nr:carbohydrate ABC transporter permease [Clostridia bacterium]
MRRYYKETHGTKAFDVFNVVLMFLFMLSIIFPFWNQLCVSFSDVSTYPVSNITVLPLGFNTEAYQKVFSDQRILRVSLVSVMRVIFGTTGTLLCTGLLAYITTIEWFSGRKFLRRAFLLTMYFSAGLIPTYLAFISIGLYNTFCVYIIPGLFSAYYMLIIASYISNMPTALFEAARIDGAAELKIYFRVVLPISIPVFAAIAVYCAVDQWNSWFDTTIYAPNGQWDTLQIYLRRVLLEIEALSMIEDSSKALSKFKTLTPQSIRAATTIIVTLPIVCVYPFLQKYFLTGITIGAVKE